MIASGTLPDLMTIDWSDPNLNQMISAKMLTPFEANSTESEDQTALYSLWDKTLPSLLNAKSDADFDKVMSDYVAKR